MDAPHPIVLDIPHIGRWARFRWLQVLKVLLIIVLASALGAIGILFLRANPIAPLWIVPIGLWLAIMSTVVSWSIATRTRTRKRVAAIVAQQPADPRAAMEAILPTLAYRYIIVGMNEAAKRIRAAGHSGLILRVGPPETLAPVDPLRVEFEPFPINETDPAFIALQAGDAQPQAGPIAPPTRPAEKPRTSDDDSPILRSLRRASRLGRTRFWIIFGVMFLLAAIDAFERRQITTRAVIWGVVFSFSLIGPMVLAAERGLRFLLLPSSLLWRRSGVRKTGYDLHLFERGKSLLCVYHFRRSAWVWTVADESNQVFSLATGDEINMLLRGWLSPLPPPPLSRLSEFAGN